MARTQVKIFVEPVGVLDTTVKRIVIDREPRIQWNLLMQKVFAKLNYERHDMALWILVEDREKKQEKWEEFTQEKWEEEKDPIKLSRLTRLRAVKKTNVWTDKKGNIVDEIKVYIDGESLKKHCSGKYNASNIFQWIHNSWRFTDIEDGDCVPKIVQESNMEDAHIRMEFRENERSSYTRSASEVKSGAVKRTEPTVIFDFSQMGQDHEIKKLTKHEFGHALGLYHEHQNPKFLDVMRQCYQDAKQMMKASPGLKLEDFKLQNLELSDYDPDFVKDIYDSESIMHYRVHYTYLKEDLRDEMEQMPREESRRDWKKFCHASQLNPDDDAVIGALNGFKYHAVQANHDFISEPSKEDKRIIAAAYHKYKLWLNQRTR